MIAFGRRTLWIGLRYFGHRDLSWFDGRSIAAMLARPGQGCGVGVATTRLDEGSESNQWELFSDANRLPERWQERPLLRRGAISLEGLQWARCRRHRAAERPLLRSPLWPA
jgi:hypothetical protein